MPSQTNMNHGGYSSFARFKSLYIVADRRPAASPPPKMIVVISHHPIIMMYGDILIPGEHGSGTDLAIRMISSCPIGDRFCPASQAIRPPLCNRFLWS